LPNASATYSHLFDIVQSEGGHFHSFHEDEVLRDEMGADFFDSFVQESNWNHLDAIEQLTYDYPELASLSDHEIMFVFQDYYQALFDTLFSYIDGEGVAWNTAMLADEALVDSNVALLSTCDPESRDGCFEVEHERFRSDLGLIVGGLSVSASLCLSGVITAGPNPVSLTLLFTCSLVTSFVTAGSIGVAIVNYNNAKDQCRDWFGEEDCEGEGDEDGDDRPIAGGGGPIPPWGPSPIPWQPQGPIWIPPAPGPVGGTGGCETHLAEDPENTRLPCRPEEEEDEEEEVN